MILGLLLIASHRAALGQEYIQKTLMLFGDPDVRTGINPQGNLALGQDGRLYGTAGSGTNYSTVFGISTDGTGFSVLHHFGDVAGDGKDPQDGVIEASDGVLYGTTQYGGSVNQGIVFKINKDGSGYQILREFQNYPTDGANPRGGLIEGSDGMLYGSTFFGGAAVGTVFRLNKDGTGYSIIKSLSRRGAEGASPSGVIEATDGFLYGMTYLGGSGQGGTIFKLSKDSTSFTVIWNFQQDTNGYRGMSSLLEGSDGVLYGTTTAGGVTANPGSGTIFKINKDGSGFSVLHRFDRTPPDVGDHRLVEAGDGALYGARTFGYGNVYRLGKDGSGFTLLYNFSGTNGDGASPFAGLTKGKSGEFYGSTAQGGKRGPSGQFYESYGTLFLLRPGVKILGVSRESNGRVLLRFVGQSGRSYDLQAADNLSASPWNKLGTVVAGADGQFQFEDSDAPNHPARFYRTVEQ